MSGYLWLTFAQERLVDRAKAAIRDTYGPASVAAPIRLRVSPPWLPGEVVPGLPSRAMMRAMILEPGDRRGRILTDAAIERLAADPRGPVGRGSDPWPGDPPARRLSNSAGAVLALGWRDPAPGSVACAYAAIFRAGRCRWSVHLDVGQRLARWDGEGARIVKKPRRFPEGDRVGVWVAGLERLLGERVRLDDADAAVLPELLEETVWG